MTKEAELLRWMKNTKTFYTHDILRWAVDNYYDRADRTKRDFVDKGLIRKMGEFEKETKGFTAKDAVYEANEKEIERYFQQRLF